MKRLCIVCFLLLVAARGMPQDIVTIAPKNAKVVFENERVRVVRLTMAPHETTPMQDRPSRVVIGLTASTARLTAPDGSTHDVAVPAGNVGWGGPTRRSVMNLDTPLENVIVEIKNANKPAQRITHPPSSEDPRALIEPDHHWLFENQYVRVYDARVPSGTTTEFHKHAYDSVFVQVTDEVSSEQSQGGAWQKPQKYAAGQVAFSSDFKKPRIHRVRNDGPQEFHVVVVQLMP